VHVSDFTHPLYMYMYHTSLRNYTMFSAAKAKPGKE